MRGIELTHEAFNLSYSQQHKFYEIMLVSFEYYSLSDSYPILLELLKHKKVASKHFPSQITRLNNIMKLLDAHVSRLVFGGSDPR